MSPEQAHSSGYMRASSDQYSLGLVLFEMLTSKAYKRLERPEAEGLLAAQPESVRALVARLTSDDPAARFPGMAAVHTAIRALDLDLEDGSAFESSLTIRGTADASQLIPPPSPKPRLKWHRPWLAPLLGVLGVIAGAVLV